MSEWRKSSRSPTGNECVELKPEENGEAWKTRDSKNPSGGVLDFSGPAWRSFLATVKR